MSQTAEPTENITLDGSQARLCKVITAAYLKASAGYIPLETLRKTTKLPTRTYNAQNMNTEYPELK